mmetsp:Transcript_7814/g.13541  ORF Transcript_7814/g.13541 Transcript_7814/m.13541 type:complete len:216 (-) Transcript_7814:41-688(-)
MAQAFMFRDRRRRRPAAICFAVAALIFVLPFGSPCFQPGFQSRLSVARHAYMEEDKSGWSEAERQALSFLEEKQPKWRRSYLGPKTEAQVRETFQAISWAAGGETQGLKAIEKNLALMVFLPEQIRASAEALTGELGQKEASDIIQKNPGVLTIPPESIKQNVGAIVPLSSVVGFFSDNPVISQGLFAILGIAVIYAVVVVGVINPLIKAYPGNQ